MNLHLSDKHVLITGGSKGIGLACAHAFLEEGARVTLISRDAANLNNALQKLHVHFPAERIHTVAANLRDAAHALTALNSAEAAFGPVDVLVNSAGAAKRTPAPELTPEAFADAMQAKYFTTIHMLTPTIQRMAARGQGTVVNIVGNGGKVASPIHLPGGAANAGGSGARGADGWERSPPAHPEMPSAAIVMAALRTTNRVHRIPRACATR